MDAIIIDVEGKRDSGDDILVVEARAEKAMKGFIFIGLAVVALSVFAEEGSGENATVVFLEPAEGVSDRP